MKQKLQDYASRYGYFSKERPLIARVTESAGDIGIAAQFLELANGAFENLEEREQARAEILAKIVAYRELTVGMEIEAYVVDTVFDLWQGIPAFGLVSKTEAPILLFRGTDPRLHRKKALASVLSNFDLHGPGLFMFKRARPCLRKWMKMHHPRVIGHSLGGALTFYTLLFESGLVCSDKPSYAFNALGLYSSLLQQWKGLAYRPPLITIVSEGDLVSKVGTQIGEIRSYPETGPIKSHVMLICAEHSAGS